jgi:hypothetical protein
MGFFISLTNKKAFKVLISNLISFCKTKTMYRHTLLGFLFVLFISTASAQKDSIDAYFTLRISDYMVKLDDSTTVVQVAIPDAWPVVIKDKQIGVLKHRYESGKEYDTSAIGWGKCYLIKEEWHYFTIKRYNDRAPMQGDLLVTKCRLPRAHTGILFNLARNGISFSRVDETQFYNSGEVFYFGPGTEQAMIDSMAADIRYTGKAMAEQNDGQDQVIEGGNYSGKKLFATMQTVTKTDVLKFLKYASARPSKYAGNVWKVSEVFATWMVSKTPEVIE